MNTIQKQLDMEKSLLSTTTTPLKGKPAYTIINVCVFVNTIQKEMNTEMDME